MVFFEPRDVRETIWTTLVSVGFLCRHLFLRSQALFWFTTICFVPRELWQRMTTAKRFVHLQGPYRVIVNSVTNETDDFKSRGLIYSKIFGTHPKSREPQYLWGESRFFSELTDDMIVSAFLSAKLVNGILFFANTFVFDTVIKICHSLPINKIFELFYQPKL